VTSLLRIISTCKPFVGDDAMRQRNAIRSWMTLVQPEEIVLVGDDDGVEEVCLEFGLTFRPDVDRVDGRLPSLASLLTDEFVHSTEFLCLVNADIVLPSSLITALEKTRASLDLFLLTGERWGVSIKSDLSNEQLTGPQFFEHARAVGCLPGPHWIDYFVFPPALLSPVPPLAVAGYLWDHWIVGRALDNGAAVVDATNFVTAVHQDHGIAAPSHAELRRSNNARVIGDQSKLATIANATHILEADGTIRRARSKKYVMGRALRRLGPIVRATRPIRVRLGLTLDNAFRLARRRKVY
jgi:hypothetical protein